MWLIYDQRITIYILLLFLYDFNTLFIDDTHIFTTTDLADISAALSETKRRSLDANL